MASASNNVNIISKVLQSCYVELVQDLNIGRLVDYLFQEGCISHEEKNCIQAIAVEQARNRKLLDILSTKDDRALDILLKYFQMDGTQLHLFRIVHERKTLVLSELIVVQGNRREACILPSKWWPEEKPLSNSFIERQMVYEGEDRLVVDYIYAQLQSDRTSAIISNNKQSIVGMGGIGKTTTAKWYANKYHREYTHIIWIDSDGPAFSKSFKSLAKVLNPKFEFDKKDFHDIVKEVYNQLKNTTCLFIFDNAESYDGQNGLRCLLPNHSLHYCLITSRYQEWGNGSEFGQISTFELDVFTAAECIDFLKLGTKEEYSHEMEELGKELGYLPLALHVAVAIINKRNRFHTYTISSYLDRIRQDIRALTEETVLSEYERPVSASLQLTLKHIETNELISSRCRELCKTILYITAYCVPEEIELDLFEKIPNVEKYLVENAIQNLLAYSLVSMMPNASKKALNIHRLLQVALKNRLEENPDEMTYVLGIAFNCMESDLDMYDKHVHNAWTIGARYNAIIKAHSHVGIELLSRKIGSVSDEIYVDTLGSFRRVFDENGMEIVELELIHGYNLMKYNCSLSASNRAKALAENLIMISDSWNHANPHKQQFIIHSKLLLAYVIYRNNCSPSWSVDNTLKEPLPKNGLNYCKEILCLYKKILDQLKTMDYNDGTRNGRRTTYCMLWGHKIKKSTIQFKMALMFDYSHLLCLTNQGELGLKLLWDFFSTNLNDNQEKLIYMRYLYNVIRVHKICFRIDLFYNSVYKCYKYATEYIQLHATKKIYPAIFNWLDVGRLFADIFWGRLNVLLLQGKFEGAKEAHTFILSSSQERYMPEVGYTLFSSYYSIWKELRSEGKHKEAFHLCQIVWDSWISAFKEGGNRYRFCRFFYMNSYYTQELLVREEFDKALQLEGEISQLFTSFIDHVNLRDLILGPYPRDHDFVLFYKVLAKQVHVVAIHEIYRLKLNNYLKVTGMFKVQDVPNEGDWEYKSYNLIDIYVAAICIHAILRELEDVIKLTEVLMENVIMINFTCRLKYFISRIVTCAFPILELMGEQRTIRKLLKAMSKRICDFLSDDKTPSNYYFIDQLLSGHPVLIDLIKSEVIKLIDCNEIVKSVRIIEGLGIVGKDYITAAHATRLHGRYLKSQKYDKNADTMSTVNALCMHEEAENIQKVQEENKLDRDCIIL